jgi:hypothetical protein
MGKMWNGKIRTYFLNRNGRGQIHFGWAVHSPKSETSKALNVRTGVLCMDRGLMHICMEQVENYLGTGAEAIDRATVPAGLPLP